MNKRKIIICLLVYFTFSLIPAYTQVIKDSLKTENASLTAKKGRYTYKRKGKMYFFWGYNRSIYTNSNIRLRGNGYDFTIKNVKATDSPSRKFKTYINPSSISVPQYDWRVGYYLTDKYSVSFGHAHMKYEIEEQTTNMTGTIANGALAGIYQNTPVIVGEGLKHDNNHIHQAGDTPDGIVPRLEHCDGLNNFTFEFARKENLWVSPAKKFCLSIEVSVGMGATLTDTEANVLGEADPNHGDPDAIALGTANNELDGGSWKGFHLAGYNTSLSSTLQMEFYNRFFIQTRFTGGYVDLTHFVSTHVGGRGSQKLGYLEGVIAVGYTFRVSKK